MDSQYILNEIMYGGNWKAMKATYLKFGYKMVERAINECLEQGIKVPNVILNLRGTIKRESSDIINNILKATDFKAKCAICKYYGVDEVEDAVILCKQAGIEVPHVVEDVVGNVRSQMARELIETISTQENPADRFVLVKIYEKEIYKAVKLIKLMGGDVPSDIYDILGAMQSNVSTVEEQVMGE